MSERCFHLLFSLHSGVPNSWEESQNEILSVINCMDGRAQLPVLKFSQKRFNAEYVDTITEAGPNRILAQKKDAIKNQSILERLEISIEKHHSVGIVIAGHHDCAGNPAAKEEQMDHLYRSVQFIQDFFRSIDVIGVWVDEKWFVQELNG